jgi:hypothetical protein
MPQVRKFESNADRQAAYRQRKNVAKMERERLRRDILAVAEEVGLEDALQALSEYRQYRAEMEGEGD